MVDGGQICNPHSLQNPKMQVVVVVVVGLVVSYSRPAYHRLVGLHHFMVFHLPAQSSRETCLVCPAAVGTASGVTACDCCSHHLGCTPCSSPAAVLVVGAAGNAEVFGGAQGSQ